MNLKLLTDKKNWAKLFFVYRENKLNSSMEKSYGEKDASAKVYGFYHAYCMCDGWENLVKEQLAHVVSSGLYERIDRLYIGALIKEEDLKKLNAIIRDFSKVNILYNSSDASLMEFQTLIEMQKKCESENFLGFYFHTKGISWKKSSKIYNVGTSWRLMNEFFLFDRWKLAIRALLDGYDLYGTNYQKIFNDKYRLLGMNFFWFKSVYVKSLSKLYVARDCRNISEVWICSKTHNVYCSFEFSGNSRNHEIPKEFYIKQSPFVRVFVKTVITYFSRFTFFLKYLVGKNNQINPNVKNQRALTEDDLKYLNG